MGPPSYMRSVVDLNAVMTSSIHAFLAPHSLARKEEITYNSGGV